MFHVLFPQFWAKVLIEAVHAEVQLPHFQNQLQMEERQKNEYSVVYRHLDWRSQANFWHFSYHDAAIFSRNSDIFLDRMRYGQAMVKQPGPLCAKLRDGVQLIRVPGLCPYWFYYALSSCHDGISVSLPTHRNDSSFKVLARHCILKRLPQQGPIYCEVGMVGRAHGWA